MGCGPSVNADASKKPTAPESKRPGDKPGGKDASKQYADKPGAKKAGGAADPKGAEADPEYMKQLEELTSIFTQFSSKETKKYIIAIVRREKSVEFAALSGNEEAFSALFSEQDLAQKRGDRVTWAVLFKSLKTAFLGAKVTVKEGQTSVTLTVPLETGNGKNSITLPLKASSGNIGAMHKLFLEPLCTWFAKRKGQKDEDSYLQFEERVNQSRAQFGEVQSRVNQLSAELEPLRKNARQATDDAAAMREQCDGVLKRIAQLKNPGQAIELYADGPVRYPLHIPFAKEHVPRCVQPNKNALHLVKQKYGGNTNVQPPKADDMAHDLILETLGKIDEWGYDVFKLQEATGGGSLFMTTYCLLYKHGLVQHFNIPEDILINFLMAAESGYHPNPYHNSTHAADVLQITHFIVSVGGMAESIKMTQEDTLAALLSAAIHDYDHPGFNNNFHCRTNAYLATLFNDRSVLENHHLGQIFELMKNPKYNVLVSLTDDQRKDVRDTMIEMVLSTDMGNHAKIFQAFRKRLGDEQEWTRKEDQRLALSIAIKMADISNCARPNELYVQWAKLIANEFYNQGDAEGKLKYSISPFMDRRKHDTDFHKGQMSFMNYIVIPLFEAGAQFLPKLDFTVECIHRNRDYWQTEQ
jgi:hypothetical protein